MKTKKIKYFFLIIALMLVFGHSVLPHSHHVGSQTAFQKREVSGTSLVDIIKTGLAYNVGLNHLENYQSGKKIKLTSAEELIIGAIIINDNINFLSLKKNKKVFAEPYIFKRQFASRKLFSRGPPAC